MSAASDPRVRQRAENLERFAQMLADGVDVQTAGARLGYSRGGSQALMATLRRQLGWQAQ